MTTSLCLLYLAIDISFLKLAMSRNISEDMSFDKILDLTAEVYFHFFKKIGNYKLNTLFHVQ